MDTKKFYVELDIKFNTKFFDPTMLDPVYVVAEIKKIEKLWHILGVEGIGVEILDCYEVGDNALHKFFKQ